MDIIDKAKQELRWPGDKADIVRELISEVQRYRLQMEAWGEDWRRIVRVGDYVDESEAAVYLDLASEMEEFLNAPNR